jgi:hypothetical protein
VIEHAAAELLDPEGGPAERRHERCALLEDAQLGAREVCDGRAGDDLLFRERRELGVDPRDRDRADAADGEGHARHARGSRGGFGRTRARRREREENDRPELAKRQHPIPASRATSCP